MDRQQASSAFEKFRIVRPHLEEKVPLSKLEKLHGISSSTLKRWSRDYKENGLTGLERKQRTDKGERKLISRELEELVEALRLAKPSITITAIHRKVGQIASDNGGTLPTYRVVRDIVLKIDPSLLLLAHGGSKVYDQKYELIYRREATAPNEMWQADHTPLDIVLNDGNGIPKKPWLTSIIDDFSRAISGYYLSFENPCSINTALALHQAIWRKKDPKWQVCGIPAIFYTDNWSDFKSDHIRHVAADLKVQLKFSIPGKPQGRGRIERFCRTVNQLLLMDLPGYCPPKTVYPEAILTLNEFIPLFERFIVDGYHHRKHKGIGMPPIDRWNGKGFLPQLPWSLEQLDLLLLTVAKPRRVRRDGIHFHTLRYIEPILGAYVGEDVTIRYDPRDLAEIRIFHNGIFLCRAICQELADRSVSLKEIIRARQQRKRNLRKVMVERKSLMDTLLESPVKKQRSSAIAEQAPKLVDRSRKLKLYDND